MKPHGILGELSSYTDDDEYGEILAIPTDGNVLKGEYKRYTNRGDAHMRLGNSIIRFLGEPIRVNSAYGSIHLNCWDLIDKTPSFRINANDSRLDISSPNLGYINTHGDAVYCMRVPYRSQRQGFDISRGFFKKASSPTFSALENPAGTLSGLGRSLRNIYPSLEEVSEFRSGAFSRTWATSVSPDKSIRILHHKYLPVGYHITKEDRFVFTKEYTSRARKKSLERILATKGKEGVNYHVEGSL